jgi:universal stress protein A
MKTKTAALKRGRKLSVTGRSRRFANGLHDAVAVKSILVPVDFSELSNQAVETAATLARQFGARLTLLHVVEPAAAGAFPGFAPLLLENEKVMAACKDRLAQLVRGRAIPAGLVEKLLVRLGRSHAEITDAARTLKTDLIILPTHGRTGLTHTLIGSTAEQVVRHAPCAVLVLHTQGRQLLRTKN